MSPLEKLKCPRPKDDDFFETEKPLDYEVTPPPVSIFSLRDAIIEAAVDCYENRHTDNVPTGPMYDAVDAYHAALRREHREGRG
jgi:hypothetical protein